ncbi:MAG TPA: CheB methylesterase domain-containing protein, partial [Blastocatellia bacterium]|nr:CheB methylesterase domain-containing protein [Blastocatellia bacterium]
SRNFPVPVVIVQHIAPGFVGGFADWLGQASEVPVHVAVAGQELLPGRAYLAPDGSHMGIGPDRRVVLIKGAGGNEICPSISHLFGSVAEVYRQQAVGVLLTGMGRDGADQLKTMRDAGAITIVQDKESSIVYGMPQAAINLDAACYIYPPKRIAEVLVSLVKKR